MRDNRNAFQGGWLLIQELKRIPDDLFKGPRPQFMFMSNIIEKLKLGAYITVNGYNDLPLAFSIMCHQVIQIFECGHNHASKIVPCKKPTEKCQDVFLRQDLQDTRGLCIVSKGRLPSSVISNCSM